MPATVAASTPPAAAIQRIHVQMTVPMYRTVRTEHENGGVSHRSVADGTLTGELTLIIDTDSIIKQLGPKALRSKTKRAGALGGFVKVVVDKTSIEREGAAV